MSKPDEQTSQLLVAVSVQGQSDEDWRGTPKRLFRRAIDAIARFSLKHPEVVDAAEAIGGMALRRVEGEASAKYAAAVKDFAAAESARIDSELARRTISAKVELNEALAQKAKAEADTAVTDAIAARLELLERLQKLGVVPVQIGPNEYKMQRVLRAFTEEELRDFGLVSEAPDGDRPPKRRAR